MLIALLGMNFGLGLPNEPLPIAPLYGMVLVPLFWGHFHAVYAKDRVVSRSFCIIMGDLQTRMVIYNVFTPMFLLL